MKIYFSAAIYHKAKFGWAYMETIEALETLGHEVFQDAIDVSFQKIYYETSQAERIAYYRKILRWISLVDLVVLEVSFPSTLHLGHELSLSLAKGKPVIALFHEGCEPSFFMGMENEKVFLEPYIEGEIYDILKQVLPEAYEQRDIRYNFYASPAQLAFLTREAQRQGLTRAVLMRQLIERDMRKNSRFHLGAQPF